MSKETRFVEFYCRFSALNEEDLEEKKNIYGDNIPEEEKYEWGFVIIDVNCVEAINPTEEGMDLITVQTRASDLGYVILYNYNKFKSEFMTGTIDRVPKDVRDYLKKQELLDEC